MKTKGLWKILLKIWFLWGGVLLLEGAEPQAAQLSRILDLSLDLKGVVQLVEKKEFNPASFKKFVLIDGSIAGITILEKNPANFTAELELVQGEWIGTEEVKLYRAYVYAQGPSFASLLSSSLKANDYVWVIGNLEDVYTDDAGGRYPVIVALSIRKLH